MIIRSRTYVGSPDDAPHPPPHPSPIADKSDESDDDVLLAKLAARAWDPGLRFETAHVPTTWLVERYGPDRPAQLAARAVSQAADGTDLELPSRSLEVAAYFADAPRGPLFAPATASDVEKAERRLGRPLPELLRRVYTEVGDGGFGPDAGIASLRRNNRAPGHTQDWPCAVRERTGRAWDREPPRSWLFLTDCGCTVEAHLSLIAIDSPVLVYDADWWKPEQGQGPHDAVHYAMPLRRWLSIWANGGDVWQHLVTDTPHVADQAHIGLPTTPSSPPRRA